MKGWTLCQKETLLSLPLYGRGSAIVDVMKIPSKSGLPSKGTVWVGCSPENKNTASYMHVCHEVVGYPGALVKHVSVGLAQKKERERDVKGTKSEAFLAVLRYIPKSLGRASFCCYFRARQIASDKINCCIGLQTLQTFENLGPCLGPCVSFAFRNTAKIVGIA